MAKHKQWSFPADDGAKSPFSSAAAGAKTASDYSKPQNWKAVESETHGRVMAERRYGKLEQPNMKPKDMSQPQFKQSDGQGPDCNNQVPTSSWLRGGGESGKPPGSWDPRNRCVAELEQIAGIEKEFD